MKLRYLLIALAPLLSLNTYAGEPPAPATISAAPVRWQICQTVGGVSYEGKEGNRSENSILLDTQTGKTWILWPTKDTPSGYSWIEVNQRKDAPKTNE